MKNGFKIGLTSVTFRGKTVWEIATLAHQAGLSYIEWGGDVHVRPGNGDDVASAKDAMRAFGLSCLSYGSYYRVGTGQEADFSVICETAAALGAGTVRVWLGTKSSAATSDAERESLLAETCRMAEVAKSLGLTVAFEFHGKTYNDTGITSAGFLRDCPAENIKTYWQPLSFGDSCENLHAVLNRLSTVHVFHWDGENRRYPLSDGRVNWMAYLRILRQESIFCPLILEFVVGDDDEQFLRDAATLRALAADAEEESTKKSLL